VLPQGTTITLPRRVRISDGAILPPSGINPYTLPFVEGSFDGRSEAFREKHAKQITDLREKQKVLARKRQEKEAASA